ncbi:hypothetical protein QBC34DRAFT_441078 [Podospora aff. communis PSN243]|uniref:Rhodopsin domain-containing protein n=1 Tax=Podospora aff. communis PSN243 TaxID=3040156 RepID=A0AAV9GFR5_9PEZI|nr:hypothetical protein QBC34DRAFT_441078 [Podospora aff. communis PSN243]
MENGANHSDLEKVDFGPLLNLSIWTLSGASTGFLGLRLWAKVQRGRCLWYDDYFLVAAWASLIVSCIVQSVSVQLGFGKEFGAIAPELVGTARLISVIAGFFLILAACWSKTSFAITLLRISHGWPKRLVIFVICSINFFFVASGVIHWAQCWPLRLLWEQELEGECLPIQIVNGYNMFVAAYSGLMDIALAMLPWIIFRTGDNPALDSEANRLHRKEKIGISVAMSMAVFAGITSFLKIYAIIRVNMPNAQPEHVVGLMVLGTAEGAITIMAVSIPVLRTLQGKLKAEVVGLQLK